ncbi:hypothetical protein Pla110_44370 [Polystyrenella longa]|uniref:Uncharacterized protein n=1 Tax=Polystyrenella longa TaxID=2528007 RepID=A0A518CTX1_9PLAN|nr:hypothetical protein [Polystyrenella longa]QDU82676.1 hypothetical protein Pla110_44370 [Polystyrenella longa]
MSTTDLTGPFAIAVAKLRRMLSLSTTFQLARGVVNEQDALSFIHTRDYRMNPERPLGIVHPGSTFGYQKVSGGAQYQLQPHGVVELYLSIDVPAEYQNDEIQADLFAADYFSNIITDIAALSAAEDPESDTSHLDITNADLSFYACTDKEDWPTIGQFYFAYILFQWGGEG